MFLRKILIILYKCDRMNAMKYKKIPQSSKNFPNKVIGRHVYSNMYGIDPKLLVDAKKLEQIVSVNPNA